MRIRHPAAAACCLAVLTGCAPTDRPPPSTATATVVRVLDGDTIVLRNAGRARLIGVDAPETRPPRDCFGREATRALRRLVPPGTTVRVGGDRETYDRYGRRLVYLWTGRFINAELIGEGFARAMLIRPNNRFWALLRSAEATARRHRRGLWRACS